MAGPQVHFIGNSFTARNDLPGLIARIAAGRNQAMEYRLISANISPKKTWEGSIGALAVSLALPWLLRFSFLA